MDEVALEVSKIISFYSSLSNNKLLTVSELFMTKIA
jgi:hypothetical protein